jgi:type I restriction enzyme S subunit
LFALFDANGQIGFVDKTNILCDYITIVKDGAGVGRVRILPSKTNFISTMGAILPNKDIDLHFLYNILKQKDFLQSTNGSTIPHVYFSEYGKDIVMTPTISEQRKLGALFTAIDHIITLHQRKQKTI